MSYNMLGISWHDSAWIPMLKPGNVLDYFSERSNPFYDRTCNNEVIKMQRLNPEQMKNMTGIEYILLYAQEPILYVIRKQHRHQPNQVTPLCDYYILAGVVYQAPDIGSVINARMLSSAHHLQSAFEEALSYTRYHPSKGYWWEFKDQDPADKKNKKVKVKEEMSSLFQRQRVDLLLNELTKHFPPKCPAPNPIAAPPVAPPSTTTPSEKLIPEENIKQEKIEIKTEKPDWTTANLPPAAGPSTPAPAPTPQAAPIANRNSCKPPPEKKMR